MNDRTFNYAALACRSRHHARLHQRKGAYSMEPWAAPFQRLDEIIEQQAEVGADVAVKLETATECCWSCELRWTQRPNDPDGPDVSIVFYAGGGGLPEHALAECLLALEDEIKVAATGP